jgi:hypothetical protein
LCIDKTGDWEEYAANAKPWNRIALENLDHARLTAAGGAAARCRLLGCRDVLAQAPRGHPECVCWQPNADFDAAAIAKPNSNFNANAYFHPRAYCDADGYSHFDSYPHLHTPAFAYGYFDSHSHADLHTNIHPHTYSSAPNA